MRIIRLPEVMRKTGLSRSCIYADSTFPKRIKLGKRSVGWCEAEVHEWMQARIESRE